MVAWQLWLERNNKVHRKSAVEADLLVVKAASWWELYLSGRCEEGGAITESGEGMQSSRTEQMTCR